MKLFSKYSCNEWGIVFVRRGKVYFSREKKLEGLDLETGFFFKRNRININGRILFNEKYAILNDSQSGSFLIDLDLENKNQIIINNKALLLININSNGIALCNNVDFSTNGLWIDLENNKELWENEKDSGFQIYLNEKNEIFQTEWKIKVSSHNFLTGETLWQRSFKELGIDNLDKFIGDIDNVLICACGKTILGLDKNTGEELWRVNHYIELANAILNQANGCVYLFYGWSGPENNFSETNNITFLEIEAQTGKVLYDNSIFKHPNYIELNGLRHYEGTGDYPRFYNALQWKQKIYFLINSWHSAMVKIMEFDTVNKLISHLTEQSYEANSNSGWFLAEGKLFIQSRISQQIESEENPDPLYWSKIYSKSQFDGEHMHYQHFAISKESYLTIFDLEDN